MATSADEIALRPISDSAFRKLDMPTVELGWLLFYDRILSGNRNVACATCHHPAFGTSDEVSLSFGDGGSGLGRARKPLDGDNRPEQRIGRNSPALFNLGAAEFEVLFHDGRLEADPSKKSAIRTPLDEDMVVGFDSVLSAQAMFPVLSGDEMAGHYSENHVARAVRRGMLASEGGAWDIIAERVRAVPDYVDRFRKIDPTIGTPDDIGFTDISNVMAAFIAFEFRADDSPFDRFLRGEGDLPAEAAQGMELFYGKAGCSRCHSGVFQTDHEFHAIAMPQIGPGKAARFETHQRDVGRMRVTGRDQDKYRFRTPSLRNIELTAPYGHAGAYA
ncbi:MAG: cytochrome-c peroxidase, partial [Geminicoccaceae bacterium]